MTRILFTITVCAYSSANLVKIGQMPNLIVK